MPKPSPNEIIRIGNALEELARERGADGQITYGDLADQLGFPPVTECWTSHSFCEIFSALDELDHAAERPFRTALVISSRNKFPFPGPGFFAMLKSKRYSGAKAKGFEARKYAIYVEELLALARYYGKPVAGCAGAESNN